jgi:hypothetical protein
MITLKYPSEITKVPRTDPAYPLIKEYIQLTMRTSDANAPPWDPDSEGFLAILEPTDVGINLGEVYDGLFEELPFEGVMKRDGFYVAIVLYNNSYGHLILVEDASWIDGPIRDALEENLNP